MAPALKTLTIFAPLCIALSMSSCGGSSGQTDATDTLTIITDPTSDDTNTVSSDHYIIPDTHESQTDEEWDSRTEVIVHFEGDSITIIGNGASPDEGSLKITEAGTYRINGILDNGGILVDAGEDATVRLVLDGVEIMHPSSAPINIQSAEKTIIVLEDSSSNIVTDEQAYIFTTPDEDEPNAAIFSKDDLTITGNGLLTINANYNDGMTSKDGLIINNANITINAKDDGIRGKDYLLINNGSLTLNTGGDGLKSDNDDEDTGYIVIENGTYTITSGADAIQASSNIQITGGLFQLTTAGGHNQSLAESDSAKGLKAGVNLFIDSGNFSIDSADDAVHSNNGITIEQGTFSIETGDDGIHADTELTINDGNILVSDAYEGIESAVININGGHLDISATDDGINVAGGVDSSGISRGDPYTVNTNFTLNIAGGYVLVNSTGDGLDVNGNVTMSGGTVIVNGPTASMNGAIDYDGSFVLQGGTLLAVGSSQMAQAPDSDSPQPWLGLRFSSLPANELLHMENSAGEMVFTFAPAKTYASFIYSSPRLSSRESYTLSTGGTSTGTPTDGLYSTGDYSGGTLKYTFSP